MKTLLRCLFAALLVFCLTASISAQVHISGNLQGVLQDTTYIVDDSIYVQANDSLTIEPGAVVQFAGNFIFRICGYLNAVGTSEDSIIFEPLGLDPGGSLIFGNSQTYVAASRSCVLAYCRLSGFSGSGLNSYWGGITISHCAIVNNHANWGGGVYLSHDSTQFTDCLISGNESVKNGGGVYCTGAAPTLTNCVITNNLCNLEYGNSGHGGGGLCANHLSSPVIIGCTFNNNHSNTSGGGLTLNDASYATLSHCLITGNSADSCGGGIAILKSEYNPSAPTITNCTLDNNQADMWGGGIYVDRSTPTIKNLIVTGSQGNGGVFLDTAASAVIQYSNFDNPLTANFVSRPQHTNLGQLTTVNVNGDSCDAFFNILQNPLYLDLQNGDYHLQAVSPCVDAGDPSFFLDPDSTIADMGAFYFDQSSPVVKPPPRLAMDGLLPVRLGPNPFNPSTAISYQLQAASQVKLTVWDAAGRLVATLADGWQSLGYHEIVFDGRDLASGVYIYRLVTGKNLTSGKMVLLK